MGVYKCIKSVDDQMSCNGSCVKNGKTRYGKQRYLCRTCGGSFVALYENKACAPGVDKSIKAFLKEGCGIRSIARLLQLSATTVLRRIRVIAANLLKPPLEPCKEYELDELCTFAGSKAAQL